MAAASANDRSRCGVPSRARRCRRGTCGDAPPPRYPPLHPGNPPPVPPHRAVPGLSRPGRSHAPCHKQPLFPGLGTGHTGNRAGEPPAGTVKRTSTPRPAPAGTATPGLAAFQGNREENGSPAAAGGDTGRGKDEALPVRPLHLPARPRRDSGKFLAGFGTGCCRSAPAPGGRRESRSALPTERRLLLQLRPSARSHLGSGSRGISHPLRLPRSCLPLILGGGIQHTARGNDPSGTAGRCMK